MEKYLDAFEKYAKAIGWDRVCFEEDEYLENIYVTLSMGKPSMTSDFMFEFQEPEDKEETLRALYDGIYFGKEAYLDTNEPWSDLEEKMFDQICNTLSAINMIYDFLDSAA